jgi:two-component system, LytTR family, response regulator
VTYSVVIVEDEPPARAKLTRFIAELADFRVAAEAATVDEGIAAVTQAVPDVLFLDIQLGTRSGFDVIDGLRDVGAPLIVFTTAYSEYAVRAFEIEAVDYLLKPFDRDRFMRGIERIRAVLAEPDRSDIEERVRRLLAGIPGRPSCARQILVRETDRAFFLDVDDIQRVSASGNYVGIYAGGKVHLVRDSLTSFAAQLDPAEFLRVHRSHVVRVSFIAELRPMFHGAYELVLRDGKTLALSRRYKALLPPGIRDRL